MVRTILVALIALFLFIPNVKSSSRVEDVNYSHSYSTIASISPLKKGREARAKNKRYRAYQEVPPSEHSGLIATAHRYLGVNPTGKRSLWCADFLNLVLKQNGYKTTNSRAARSFYTYGNRSTGNVGDIAVMHRGRNGGHVGLVAGYCDNGHVKILSGNFGRQKVGYGCYPRSRIVAFRST